MYTCDNVNNTLQLCVKNSVYLCGHLTSICLSTFCRSFCLSRRACIFLKVNGAENQILVNVLQGRNNQFANFQFKWSGSGLMLRRSKWTAAFAGGTGLACVSSYFCKIGFSLVCLKFRFWDN